MHRCIYVHQNLLWFFVRSESRTERNKREVRGRIVAAAAELFDEHGVEATKVEAICDQADIALRTFFNHFPTKRDVVDQLAIDATSEVAARVRSVHAQGRSTRERLELFFAQSIEASLRGGPTHRELLAALVAVPVGAENLRAAREPMLDLLRDGVAAGDIASDHAVETLADVVIGTFYRIIIDWTNTDDYEIREHLSNACRFLCDAIAPE
ncbi:MAG: TetR/AcrR family transcriptional regulator [Myxococcales bacterium]|nr:TetR/AcrR family transcriptional regulator [Myxococcales bacterium]